MPSMTKTHEHWSSKLGFIMATAGAAVGLGSLWKFPYVAGANGGGAFVLLYIIFTLIIGLPVFIGELIIGRKTQKSSVLAFPSLRKNGENWRGLGWLNFMTTLLILSYYCIIAGWVLSYIFMSLTKFSAGKSPEEIQESFTLLSSSPGISLLWFALYLLINLGIICSGIKKGIEHFAKILMPALFILLIGLFFYAVTMPGFGRAVDFVFYPKFENLSGQGVLNALGMAFFTLSVGLGINITYGSYMQKKENIPINSLIITAMTVFVSLIAALVIFPIVFTFGFAPEEGPGLIFKTLPVVFAKLPGTVLLSTMFFSLVLFAALTSTIALLEVLVANIIENFSISRTRAAIVLTGLIFVLGIPSALSGTDTLFPSWSTIYSKSFFDTIDYLTQNWMLPVSALFTAIFVGWFTDKKDIQHQFATGTSLTWLASPWFFMVKYIAPLLVIIIILQEAGLIKI
jgi:NSS family neurotransmitter:Na+ symporter